MKKVININGYLRDRFKKIVKENSESTDKVCDSIEELSDKESVRHKLLDMYEDHIAGERDDC